MAKQDALRRHTPGRFWWKLWHRILAGTIGYGYEPWRALIPLLALFVIGSGVFWLARELDVMTPPRTDRTPTGAAAAAATASKPPTATPASYRACVEGYPCFAPDALESMVPLVDLQQRKYWLPDATRPYGWVFRSYMWGHTILGWVFTTLAVASLTGLIKKD